MSFIIFDLAFLVVFSLAIGIFLYVERKKLQKDGWLYLYKTKIGLEIIDYIGKRYKKQLHILSYLVIFTGYVLMVMSVYFILKLVYFFTNPAFVQAVKVPPIMPLIPYLPELFQVTWLPPFYFTYWILAILIIALFHEGAHGIYARTNNIRIKSTGFGFLGPFLAFFVEQDDKQMQKSSPYKQMSLIAAGVFANMVIALIFFLLLVWFAGSAYTSCGVVFTGYSYTPMNTSALGSAIIMNETLNIEGKNLTLAKINNQSYFVYSELFNLTSSGKYKDLVLPVYYDSPAIRNKMQGAITQINGKSIKNTADFKSEMNNYAPGDKVSFTTEYKLNDTFYIKTYNFNLAADYNNQSRAVIGIATLNPRAEGFRGFTQGIISFFKDPAVYYRPKFNPDFTKFIYDLLWWMFLINMSVALANMIPLGIFDGGRYFYLTVLLITGKEKIAEKAFKWTTWFLLALIALMMVFYFKAMLHW